MSEIRMRKTRSYLIYASRTILFGVLAPSLSVIILFQSIFALEYFFVAMPNEDSAKEFLANYGLTLVLLIPWGLVVGILGMLNHYINRYSLSLNEPLIPAKGLIYMNRYMENYFPGKFRTDEEIKKIPGSDRIPKLDRSKVRGNQEAAAIPKATPTVAVSKGREYDLYPAGPVYYEIGAKIETIPESNVKLKMNEVLDVVKSIFENFKQDPSDIPRSRDILPNFLSSMNQVISYYFNLTHNQKHLPAKKAKEVETKVIGMMEKLKAALSKHLEDLLENDNIGLDSEIELLSKLIDAEGLNQ